MLLCDIIANWLTGGKITRLEKCVSDMTAVAEHAMENANKANAAAKAASAAIRHVEVQVPDEYSIEYCSLFSTLVRDYRFIFFVKRLESDCVTKIAAGTNKDALDVAGLLKGISVVWGAMCALDKRGESISKRAEIIKKQAERGETDE